MKFEDAIQKKFPDLRIVSGTIHNLSVEKSNADIERFKKQVFENIQNSYEIGTLKDNRTFRSYRDFFWRLDIDPTKIRPASEALIRRILLDRPIPNINTAVDAYNLASIETGIPLGAFDLDVLEGCLEMRFSNAGEEFLGIGMKEPKILKGGEIVILDSEKLIAVYPYRDADRSKVELKTKNIYLLSCGVPSVDSKILINAYNRGMENLKRFCGGDFLEGKVFP